MTFSCRNGQDSIRKKPTRRPDRAVLQERAASIIKKSLRSNLKDGVGIGFPKRSCSIKERERDGRPAQCHRAQGV
jgi:hypothetical protein